MRSVVKDCATRKDFSALYARWKREALKDLDMYVSWLSPTMFEVTNDRWADGYTFCARPDDWPLNHGEPA